MKLKEAFSGAPLFRGRYAAVFYIWLAGELFGDLDVGVVWLFVPDSVAHVGHKHWALDAFMFTLGCASLLMGVLSLDQYGRNCWFAWAGDDVEWQGLTRNDVNRKTMWRWPSSSWDWKERRWR